MGCAARRAPRRPRRGRAGPDRAPRHDRAPRRRLGPVRDPNQDAASAHTDTGRWAADAACETVTITVGDHPMRAVIGDGRLETIAAAGHAHGPRGAAFLRVSR